MPRPYRYACFTLVLALAIGSSASADRLNELLFDYQTGREFAASLERTVLELRIHPHVVSDLADPSFVSTYGALSVAVRDESGRARLLTSGPLAAAARLIEVRAPSGRWFRVGSVVQLGEGVVAELNVGDEAFRGALDPVGLELELTLRRTTPVFTVSGTGTGFPMLVKGLVIEAMKEPLKGLFINDLGFIPGTPLLTADRRLVGLNFRPHPSEERQSVAVGAEQLRAWLHPEGPQADPDTAAR